MPGWLVFKLDLIPFDCRVPVAESAKPQFSPIFKEVFGCGIEDSATGTPFLVFKI